jgi:hypothetical protein
MRHPILTSVILSFVGLACAVFFSIKMIPGGPFISFRGDILPHLLTGIALVLALFHYRSYTIQKRIGALFAGGLAIAFSIVIAFGTNSFFQNPYARGDFFGW